MAPSITKQTECLRSRAAKADQKAPVRPPGGSVSEQPKGLSLVEIILAITIFSMFSLGIFFLSIDTLQRDSRIELENMGLFYANEGLEATRNLRDKNFLLLTNGDHGLGFSADSWSFIAAPENIDDFYFRTITVDPVYRDANGNIVTNGGNLDPDTKKITSEVAWQVKGIFPESVSLITYLSNWTGTDVIHGTCAQLNAGSFESTETVPLPAPPPDNCGIQLDFQENPSNFFSSVNLGKHANDVVINGQNAYLAADDTQKGFTVVDISNPASPGIVTELYVWGKGRNLFKNGNYIYLGIQQSNPGIAIIDVTTPSSPSVTHAWNIGGYGNQPSANATHLFTAVEDDDDSFKVYKLQPTPQLTDFLDLNDEVRAVEISGSYAYLATEDDNLGLRVVNIADPYNITQIASKDLGEEANVVKINGIFAYVGIEDGNNSLKILNISNPANPQIVATLDVGGEIEDIAIVGDYLYAAIDDQDAGLAAVNISNPLQPLLTYNLDITAKGTGIAANDTHIFVSTDTANSGLVIVGTTINTPQATGNYTSASIDTGSTDTRYNFISWDHQEVPGGSIKFQIRTADTLDALATATWVGTDGTGNTFYENSRTAIVTDPNKTGVRYIQYKVFFTSDGLNTPVLDSVRINYNP